MISDDSIVQLINQILNSGENNEQRRVCETQLSELRDTYPNEFITGLLNLCKNPELSIRQFASVHLRNCTSTFTPKNFKNVYPQLNAQVQEYLKNQLFVLLSEETNQNVRNQLCDAIGEIGGSLYENESKNDWPNLLNMTWQLFLSPRNELIECGFKILGNLFQYAVELFDRNQNEIGALFNQGLLSPDVRIRTADLQAIGYFVTSSEYKKYKAFEDLVPAMINSTYEILVQNEDLGEEALEVFSDIVEAEYKFLRKHFTAFFNGVLRIFQEKKIDQGVKRIGTEALLILAEKSPKLFKNEKNTIVQLVEMVFYHMIQISEDIADSWKIPPEGFNDDIEQDEDCETARFGMSSIDRLIQCIGEKDMLPILSQIVGQLFQHNDWRYKYSAIMALSQVGEYIEEINEVKPIVEKVMSMLNDPNPMIRYAVCHAIGQISDDMKPKFQEAFLNYILPAFILRLQNEDVPRVTSHIYACLTNFVEGTEQGFQSYLEQVMQISVQSLQNGISIVKENAVSVIAASAEASKENFIPYFTQIMPILFKIFESHQTKEYKQLKGQTIEAISLIANCVKKDLFAPYLDATITMLLQVQEGNFETVDPQKSYVLSGWQRLCLVCPDLLGPYLPRIVPSLFKLVKIVFDTEKGDQGDTYHTYDNEEAEIAINMLSVFIEELKDKFFPYFDTCTQLIVPLCTFTTDESIRRAAAKCLVSLIENVQDNVKSTGNNAPLIQGAKYFLGILLDAAQKEFDPEVIIDQVDCMKDIIDTVKDNFMTPQELNELSEKVFKLLLESDQRKAENENIAKEEDCDEEEQTLIKEENETEEELHVKIAEFIGVLFKTHSQQVTPLCELIYTQVLPKVLDASLTPKMHQFGIFLIDDIIEHLGYNIAGAKFPDLAKALSVYAVDKVCFVRQAATYGIGILALATPKEFYPQFSGVLIGAIAQSLQIAKLENDTDKVYGHCRDNAIAALGKIIRSQPESLGVQLADALNQWLTLLPLRYDKPEARIQHGYLAEYVIQNGPAITRSVENAVQILKIFVDVYNTKKSDQETNVKIFNALKVFEQIDIVKANWNGIYATLTPENQQKLVEIAQGK